MNKIKEISEKKYFDIFFTAVFTTIAFIVVYCTCMPRMFSDDDWGIANYFTGVMGKEYATPYNKFINIIFGWLMYSLYQAIPGPNWFVIIEELIVCISFCFFHFMFIRKTKRYISCWAYFLSSSFILCFELSFLARVQFTQTAAVGSIAGMLWVLYAFEQGSKKGVISGIIVAIISSFYRIASFAMVLPYVAICMLSWIILDFCHKGRKSILNSLKKYWRQIATITGIITFGIVAMQLNNEIYNSPYYFDYNTFNSARASVLDYKKAPYDEIADELSEIGVSENDYALMTSWTFADSSFFTTELFWKVAELEPKTSAERNILEEIRKYFYALGDLTLVYNHIFYAAVVVLILCVLIDPRHMGVLSPILFVVSIIIEMYLTIFVRRYPAYVRTGLLFTLILTAVYLTDFQNMEFLRQTYWLKPIFSILVIFSLFPLGNKYYIKTKGIFEYNMDGLAMY